MGEVFFVGHLILAKTPISLQIASSAKNLCHGIVITERIYFGIPTPGDQIEKVGLAATRCPVQSENGMAHSRGGNFFMRPCQLQVHSTQRLLPQMGRGDLLVVQLMRFVEIGLRGGK